MRGQMTRLIVGPFNRVEGDLDVRLEIADGRVREAFVSSGLYRGYEQILEGRPALDALTIVPRICGICSVSQSMAAVAALRSAAGIEAPDNGRYAAALVHAAENLADHLTHSFVFFLPDFARDAYSGHPWHEAAVAAYAAGRGHRAAAVLRLRARLLHVIGLLAGKWPHSLALQVGGTTVPVDAGAKARLLGVLADVRRGLEETVFGAPLERIAGLSDADALAAWAAEAPPTSSDLRFLLMLCDGARLCDLGRCDDAFLSVGAYDVPDGPLCADGLWDGTTRPLPLEALREDVSHAWLSGPPHHPRDGHTIPDPEAADGYTFCKAPRLGGLPAQVGALARQVVDGQPLMRDLVVRHGSTAATRVLARFVEIARLVPAMERWARALKPTQPFMAPTPVLRTGAGVGLVEAARGSLGHWMEIEDGRIRRWQIVAPTTWNFSPRDAAGLPGPLERALVGTPVTDGETVPVAVQHVVRSFDPCMACTVH